MLKMMTSLAFAGVLFAQAFGGVTPASAGYLDCESAHPSRAYACAKSEAGLPATGDFAARKRPRVTIYPRRVYVGPNAVRQCRSWLVAEYRVSGAVIVPQMYCWWE